MDREINLMTYISSIEKGKRIILFFVLIGIVISIIFAFILSSIYYSETWIEVGVYSNEIMEGSENLVGKINKGIYGDYPGVKATDLKNTKLIVIKYSSRNKEDAINTLKEINDLVIESHDQLAENRRKIIRDSIEKIEEEVKQASSERDKIDLRLRIIDKEQEIDKINPTKVVKEPVIIDKEESDLIFNIISGALAGLFIGILIVFLRDWWKKNKVNL